MASELSPISAQTQGVYVEQSLPDEVLERISFAKRLRNWNLAITAGHGALIIPAGIAALESIRDLGATTPERIAKLAGYVAALGGAAIAGIRGQSYASDVKDIPQAFRIDEWEKDRQAAMEEAITRIAKNRESAECDDLVLSLTFLRDVTRPSQFPLDVVLSGLAEIIKNPEEKSYKSSYLFSKAILEEWRDVLGDERAEKVTDAVLILHEINKNHPHVSGDEMLNRVIQEMITDKYSWRSAAAQKDSSDAAVE